MRIFAQSALTIGLTAALLGGCGGLQPPGATPQTSAIPPARSAAHRFSASYQQLFRFHPPKDGTHPASGLLDVNGTLYGTTQNGGLSRRGTVYSISTGGVEKVLYRFRGGSDGSNPLSDLINVNGTLYGTTSQGGGSGCSSGHDDGCGTVYSVTTSGREKVLHAFKGGNSDGGDPLAGLIDVNGTLYGTTAYGGGSGCKLTGFPTGCGTVFSVTTTGKETVLHSFGGTDGENPAADLIDVNGLLYGTTIFGGAGCGCGTVFSITPTGAENVLYAFQGVSDGYWPLSALIDVNGTLYGTTNGGGTYCATGSGVTCGTVYSVSTTGAKKIIYQFTGGADGRNPQAGLIEVNGALYGTTPLGGVANCRGAIGGTCGTLYSVTTGGVETVLYRFASGTDGANPIAPLTNVNGTLYGTTIQGGDFDRCCIIYGYGTFFAFTP